MAARCAGTSPVEVAAGRPHDGRLTGAG